MSASVDVTNYRLRVFAPSNCAGRCRKQRRPPEAIALFSRVCEAVAKSPRPRTLLAVYVECGHRKLGDRDRASRMRRCYARAASDPLEPVVPRVCRAPHSVIRHFPGMDDATTVSDSWTWQMRLLKGTPATDRPASTATSAG